jgi:hypothetical protein
MNQTWEYRIDPTLTTQIAIQRLLDQRGAEGWELVAIDNYFYFKRAK